MVMGKGRPARSLMLAGAALVAVTLFVYLQVGNHQFLSFDDHQYVTQNPHIASGSITGENIVWAFTSVEAYNWHPLTWLSHLADARLYGLNPRGHHLSNVVLHAASSLLLLLFLSRCTGSVWRSSFVAALFALHPLHVESVAWVAERKDVLSAFFWFLTLVFYCEYAATRKRAPYLLALVSFALGLMAKPMLATLPAVMLLLDYWPLQRWPWRHLQGEKGERPSRGFFGTGRSLVAEKLPFLACSLCSVIITIYAQHKGGSVIALSALPFPLRAENALVAYVKYLGKTLWPNDLAVYYPFPAAIPLPQVVGSLFVLLLVSAAAVFAGRRHPFFAVGWCWFLFTLLPVIGLMQVGRQSMADRYMYLPATGLFIAAAWGVPELTKGWRHGKALLAVLAGVAVLASAALTWNQLGYWRDGVTLYRHTLRVTADNYLINYNLGVDLAERGEMDEAIWNLREALRIRPDFTEAHNNLGFALAGKGELDEAMLEYQAALRTNPNDAKAHANLGKVFLQKGRPDAAIGEYRAAVLANPADFDARNNLGVALAEKGDLDAAILEYRAALRMLPDNADAHGNLGVALTRKGELAAAILEYQAALRIQPDNADTLNNLRIALARQQRSDPVIR